MTQRNNNQMESGTSGSKEGGFCRRGQAPLTTGAAAAEGDRQRRRAMEAGAAAAAAVKMEEVEEEEDDEEDDEQDEEDAESVWSPDIEKSFQDALAMYPPCGRRKIILAEEGKMYGRNELIARYIRQRTGKTRSRKQVSSHIQVLARRRTKELQSSISNPAAKERALRTLSHLSSAQIVSAGLAPPPSRRAAAAGASSSSGGGATSWQQTLHPLLRRPDSPSTSSQPQQQPQPPPQQQQRPVAIAGPHLWLREIGAFVDAPWPVVGVRHRRRHAFAELRGGGVGGIGGLSLATERPAECVELSQIADKFPQGRGGLRHFFDSGGPEEAAYLVKFWADMNTQLPDEPGAFYGFSTAFESWESLSLTCSTKVCSFGKQVVEKIESQIRPREEPSGLFVYKNERSRMCDFMVSFIAKLRKLPEKYMMNTVLENFTIVQILTNEATGEPLLCVAFVFEVANGGAQHHVYRLSKG